MRGMTMKFDRETVSDFRTNVEKWTRILCVVCSDAEIKYLASTMFNLVFDTYFTASHDGRGQALTANVGATINAVTRTPTFMAARIQGMKGEVYKRLAMNPLAEITVEYGPGHIAIVNGDGKAA